MNLTFKDYRIRAARSADSAAIKKLVFGVLQDYGLQPDEGSTDADIADVETSYNSRGGFFGVVEDKEETLVGTFGLYPLEEESGRVAEVRKMYLLPSARGKGLGAFLLDELLRIAREKGFSRVELETAQVLKEAIKLYEKRGFRPVCRKEMSCRCDQAYALDL
ncbi:GNAT family N-acetyltransferase [Nafulsella turpanensis]|uniref:GNAT family N-acetyltransferase n=1 Tax=Nafulsella turpanensis TaxID=1265690 RepID=UPI0003490F55|nr:GNAT family N-acetyltransferase [Nafulsella turpanensis]